MTSGHGAPRDHLFDALVAGGMSAESATLALESFASHVLLEHVEKGGCDRMVADWRADREAARRG